MRVFLTVAVVGALSMVSTQAQAQTLPAGAVSSPIITATNADLTQGSLSGTRADGPGIAYPDGSYWLASHFDYTNGGIRHILMSGSLDAPYTSIAWNKATCVRDATTNHYCIDGTTGAPAFTSFASGVNDVVELWFTDLYWPAPGETSEVLAFIHEEQVGHTDHTRIGLAWSTDSGNSWKYLGRIISPNYDRTDGNITGTPYLVLDGYFYVYYVDSTDEETIGIGVSRASIDDVVDAARSGNLGSGLWHKFHSSAWTEPSLGGTPTFVSIPWGIPHTQAIHSSYSGKYYMPLYFQAWPTDSSHTSFINTSVKLYESTDGLSWSLASTLVDEAGSTQGPSGGYAYCSLTDPSGTPNHEAGQKFDVYCVKLQDGETTGYPYAQYRWTVNVGTVTDFYRQSVDFSSTQGPIWNYKYSSGGPITAMTWQSGGYWHGADSFDRIYPDSLHPGSSENPILTWTAPKAGTVRIGGTVRDANPGCGDGVDVRIVHNSTYLLIASLDNGDTVGIGPNLTRTVAAGDTFAFFIGPRTDNFCDSTFWDPSIEYQ